MALRLSEIWIAPIAEGNVQYDLDKPHWRIHTKVVRHRIAHMHYLSCLPGSLKISPCMLTLITKYSKGWYSGYLPGNKTYSHQFCSVQTNKLNTRNLNNYQPVHHVNFQVSILSRSLLLHVKLVNFKEYSLLQAGWCFITFTVCQITTEWNYVFGICLLGRCRHQILSQLVKSCKFALVCRVQSIWQAAIIVIVIHSRYVGNLVCNVSV